MKKNIAIMIYQMSLGGAEKTAASLAKYFKSKGYNVYLFLRQYDSKYSYDIKGVNLICKRHFSNTLSYIRYIKNLKKKLKIDVSISFIEDNNFINILSKTNDRVIVSVRTYPFEKKEKNFEKLKIKMLIRLLYNRADKVVVLSKLSKFELINNFGIKKNKLKVIYNFINPLTVKSMVLNSKDNLNTNNIITIGRLHEDKSQLSLIRAFARVHKKFPNFKLIILGEGSLKGYLKKLSYKLGISESIEFCGFQYNVYSYLNKSKVFVLTSKREGMPNAILDALSCGVPVISTDCKTGPREILAPNTDYKVNFKHIEYAKYGILIPQMVEVENIYEQDLTYTENILEQAIESLLSNEELRIKYSNLAKKRAKDFYINNIASKWDSII